MADKNFWQNIGNAMQYAHTVNNMGGSAAYVIDQAVEDLREQGKEKEAKELLDQEMAGRISSIMIGAGGPKLISAFKTAPLITGLSFAGGMAGGVGGTVLLNKGINWLSNGTHPDFGDYLKDKTKGLVGKHTGNLFNPLGWVGGGVGSKIGGSIVPVANVTSAKTFFNRLRHPIETMKFANMFQKAQAHPEIPKDYTSHLKKALKQTKFSTDKGELQYNPRTNAIEGLGRKYVDMFSRAHESGHALYTYLMRNGYNPTQYKLPGGDYVYQTPVYDAQLGPYRITDEWLADAFASKLYIPNPQGSDIPLTLLNRYQVTKDVPLSGKFKKLSDIDFEVYPDFSKSKLLEPKRLTEAERLGIPKGDRGNLSESQQEAVRDLHQYITDGKFRQKFLYDPEKGIFYFGSSSDHPSGLKTLLQLPDEQTLINRRSGTDEISWIKGGLKDGVITYFPNRNSAGFTAKMPKFGLDQSYGEALASSRGAFNTDIILTAPKTDADAVIWDLMSSGNQSDIALGQQMQKVLPITIDKPTMRTFYKQLSNTTKPGTYVSGDVGDMPLGNYAIESYSKGDASKAISDIILGEKNLITASSRTGLSPDSYISLLRQSQRPEWNLSFNRKAGFGKWNDSAVHNKHIYDAWQSARNGTLEQKQAYIQLFNDWVAPYGGAKAYINDKGAIIHPHPFIVKQKSGGTIKIKKKNLGSFTRYCNGKVTEECIRKGKNSSNPTTRKRANFAWVARHKFKHEDGGKLNYLNYFN